jgi:hypothetical protein
MPTTSGSLILIYSFECPQPLVITTIKDKPPTLEHTRENESKLEPESAGEGPFCKVCTPLARPKRPHHMAESAFYPTFNERWKNVGHKKHEG